ncbi:hypothetical protein XENORESO_018351, partial [Xenotaenia resolanae]
VHNIPLLCDKCLLLQCTCGPKMKRPAGPPREQFILWLDTSLRWVTGKLVPISSSLWARGG